MEAKVSSAIITGFSRKLVGALRLDVAIVGAGPSGLVAGYRLARAGIRAAIFEKKLSPGGGIWGGAMLNNEVVFQEELRPLLEEFGIRWRRTGKGFLTADSVETAAALIYRAVHAGATIFNGITVEDVVYKNERVAGVVINWTPVLLQGMHVDPIAIRARAVLDGTGHGATLTEKVAAKAGVRLDTPSGGVVGEKPMWVEEGERATVENTRQVYPGLFVSGMAANAVYGSARMGPIFGGMLKSGEKAAALILAMLQNNKKQPV